MRKRCKENDTAHGSTDKKLSVLITKKLLEEKYNANLHMLDKGFFTGRGRPDDRRVCHRGHSHRFGCGYGVYAIRHYGG